MTDSKFHFTDQARPRVEIGLGDTRIPAGTGVWDTAQWDTAGAKWGGIEPAWLDVSCYAHQLEFSHGRERFTDRFQPGTATVTFTNADGWADLAGTPSQVSTLSLRPGRAIRIGVELASLGLVWMWRGVVDSMVPDYDPVVHDIVTINAIDVLGDVGSTKLAQLAPGGADEWTDQRVGRILDACKFEPTKRQLDFGTVRVIQTELGAQAIDLLGVTADSEGGIVYSDVDGKIVFRSRDWQQFPTGKAPDATIGNTFHGTPAVPPTNFPSYFGANDTADVSTPDAGSIALPSSFTIYADVTMPIGTTGASRYLVGQYDGSQREWLVQRDIDGTWYFGVSATGSDAPPMRAFTTPGATPNTGELERFALSVKVAGGPSGEMALQAFVPGGGGWAPVEAAREFGATAGYLTPTIGTVTTPDPGPLPADCTFVFKVRGPATAAYGQIASQLEVTPLSWVLALAPGDGVVYFISYADGATPSYAYTATADPTGQDQWRAMSVQRNNGAGQTLLTERASTDGGVTWQVVNYGGPFPAVTPAVSTNVVRVGESSFDGRIYSVEMRTGLDPKGGTVVWRFDADDYPGTGTSYVDPRGRTWTLTSAAAITPKAPIVFDRTSPLRIGRWSGAGSSAQAWAGRIYAVELNASADPNLPGQPVWRMDAEEQPSAIYLDASRGTLTTSDAAIPAAFHILVHARKTARPSGAVATIASQAAATSQYSWQLDIGAAGTTVVRLDHSTAGTSFNGVLAVNGATPAGTDVWIGMFVDRHGGPSYTYNGVSSTDGVTWTTSGGGGTVTAADPVIFDSTAPIQIGALLAGTQLWDGRIYWIEMRTGIVPGAGSVVWRFDARDVPNAPTTTAYFDPRGRLWQLSNAGAIVRTTEPKGNPWTDARGRTWTATPDLATFVHPVDDPGRPGLPADICPSSWENSFDRAEITTQVLINRVLPATVPSMRWNLSGTTSAPPGGWEIRLNNANQQLATVMWINNTTLYSGVASPYLRNLNTDWIIKLSDVGDVSNQTRTYRVTGPATYTAGASPYFTVPVAWTEGLTAVGGEVELTMSERAPTAVLLDDLTGQTLYGVEAFELTDLIAIDSSGFAALAARYMATHGYTSVPRIEAVTLEAAGADTAMLELMATCRPEKPSRYRCHLVKGRDIFDKEMFATGIRHFISPDAWTLRIALDTAAWAAV